MTPAARSGLICRQRKYLLGGGTTFEHLRHPEVDRAPIGPIHVLSMSARSRRPHNGQHHEENLLLIRYIQNL